MDIYSLFDSKDIGEHLRKLNYEFTTPEAAFLVWKNRTMTLKEKHAAWEEIIRTMPDCSMPERPNMRAIDGFHEFLRTYMKMQDDLVEKVFFKEDAEYYYSLDLIYDDNEPYGFLHHYPYNGAYPDMESCRKAIADEGDLQIEKITVKKKTLDYFNESFIIEYNGNFEITGVDAEDMTGGEWDRLLHKSFEGMWFSFPTPFKRGDIVVSDYSPFGREYDEKCVFVLDSLAAWDKKQALENGFKKEECKHTDKTLRRLSAYGDTLDMCAGGYFQNVDGSLYGAEMHDYLSLEYYRGPLDGKKRILTALSMYLRGELDVVMLMNIYNSILQQETAAENIRCLGISDAAKKKIGLI